MNIKIFICSLITVFLGIGSFNVYADTSDTAYNDGDVFEFEGIKYKIISAADRTCKTAEGYIYGSHFHITGDHDITCFTPGNDGENIILPSNPNGFNLIEIGNYGFVRSNIQSIVIPNSVKKIGNRAFWGCRNISSITIPSNVIEFGDNIFNECKIDSIIFLGEYMTTPNKNFLSGLLKDSKVFCKEISYNAIRNSGFSNVVIGDKNYKFSFSPMYAGVKVSVEENNNFCIGSKWENLRIELKTENGDICSQIENPDSSTPYVMEGLKISGKGELTFWWNIDDEEKNEQFQVQCYNISFPDLGKLDKTSTFTSITISNFSFNDLDETVEIIEHGILFNDKKYKAENDITIISDVPVDSYCVLKPYVICRSTSETKELLASDFFSVNTKKPIFSANIVSTLTSFTISNIIVKNSNEELKILETGFIYNEKKYKDISNIITDLMPETSYNYHIRPYIIYESNSGSKEYVSSFENDIKTASWYIKNDVSITPTTLSLCMDVDSNEILPEEYWWEFNGEKYYTKDVVINGLIPGSVYDGPSVRLKYNNRVFGPYLATAKTITLPQVEIKTLNPICISETKANVFAETNIADNETGAGFQWKKYDAPSTLEPNEGYAIIFNGMLEGQIKNLQPSSYYNVRAFYKSSEGTYYYGDWVTFDPSDFSYFDPIVRTSDPQIEGNSVVLLGNVLSGSDDIISQGFQYWNNNNFTRSTDDIITVYASGQLMKTSIENLGNGNYSFRAFAETSRGFYYGDEQTFSIDISGIEEVYDENYEIEIVGYYTLNGMRYDEPQKGFNIILYNNGKTKKIIVR